MVKIYRFSNNNYRTILVMAHDEPEAFQELEKYYRNYKEQYLLLDESDEGEIQWFQAELQEFELKETYEIKQGGFFHYFE